MPDYLAPLTLLPEHMREGMQSYIEHGIKPGSFLTAVLSNDLMGAIGMADDVNVGKLHAYAVYLYSYAPRGSHGSPEAVKAWVAKGGLGVVEQVAA